MENKKGFFKLALLVVLIFILGYLAGIGTIVSAIYLKSRPFSRVLQPTRSLDQLTELLNLNQEQEQAVERILKQTQQELVDLREETKLKFRKRLEQARKEIASTLNDEQRTKFDRVVEKWKTRFKTMQRRRPKWLD